MAEMGGKVDGLESGEGWSILARVRSDSVTDLSGTGKGSKGDCLIRGRFQSGARTSY